MKALALAVLSVFAAGTAFAQDSSTQPESVAQIKAAGNGTTVNGVALNPGQVADLRVGDVVTVSQGQGMIGYGACIVRVPAGQAFTVTSTATACPPGSANGAGSVASNAPATWPYVVGGIGAAAAIGAAANGGGSSKPRPSSP